MLQLKKDAAYALLVLLYLIWNRFLRKNKRRPSYVLRSVVMLLCPVVGICFFLFGKFFFRLFSASPSILRTSSSARTA